MKYFLAAAVAATLAGPALAASTTAVDLTGWIENGAQGNNGAGTWNVQSGNDSVLQTINGEPTVFFDPTSNAQGTELAGTITVGNTTDDDFIGFVLGYQSDEFNSTSADFWLIDWKRSNQTLTAGVVGTAGLALSHVTGDTSDASLAGFNQFWNHSGVVDEKTRGATLGSTGWVTNQTYTFTLTFTSSLIEVKVDGNTELSWTSAQNGGAFTNGAFGFYNSSQGNVTYAGITSAAAPIPVPASLPLLMAGFGAMALIRRKRKAA